MPFVSATATPHNTFFVTLSLISALVVKHVTITYSFNILPFISLDGELRIEGISKYFEGLFVSFFCIVAQLKSFLFILLSLNTA